MKKTILFILTGFLYFNLFAQNAELIPPPVSDVSDTIVNENDTLPLKPDAIVIKIERGQLNPYKKKYAESLFCLVDASPEDLSNFWKSKFKNEYAIRLKPKKELLIAENMSLLEISTRMVTMYSKIEQLDNQSVISIALEANKGVFIDSIFYPEDYIKLKNFLHNTIKQYYVDYYNIVLKNLQNQHDALLKQKQLLLNEQSRISQSLIRNNQEASSARKDKLANETIVSKSDSKIRLNEERSRISTEKISSLEKELSELSANTDAEASAVSKKLERMKDIERDLKKAQSDLEKADKAVLNAQKDKTKAELKITEATATIEQEEREIAFDQTNMAHKRKELETIDKKLELKNKQISQVNRKIMRIY